MTDNVHRQFSQVTSEMISRARIAEEAARKGDTLTAKAELSRTMVNLVNLFSILNQE